MNPTAPGRMVLVSGAAQGSGYLLGPQLVLTAGHVVGGSQSCVVAVPGTGPVHGGVIWQARESSPAGDTALVLLSRPVVIDHVDLEWGFTSSVEPLRDCHATGYSAVGRRGDGTSDTVQVAGVFLAGSENRAGRYVLADGHRSPGSPAGARSPWAGLSGAPLFHGDVLIGVVVADHRPDLYGHSRVEAVPASAVFTDQQFQAVTSRYWSHLPRTGIDLSDESLRDRRFEREYAEAIRADYGRIRIFGLKSHGHGRRGWDLDTAYLSLETRPAQHTGPPRTGSGPQRVETALRGRRRVLLRGQAGSGKTTLVQWLAVRAVDGTLGAELAELNRRVPLVLQLRKLFRKGNLQPEPADFLALDDRMCAERQPPGWVHRLLKTGRGLLLVDGLDEVPEAQREEVEEWLDRLLVHYPRVWALATVRPSAVPPGWLHHLAFDELSLCPMGESDRAEFVDRWHRAALQDALPPAATAVETAALAREVEQDRLDLLATLKNSPALSQLTDSPLLCAMICALNRESDGVLPVHRMDIYRDALSMMLVKRDESRRIREPERLRLSESEQLAMLRRIAHWLVRNNQVEGAVRDAVAQLDRALRDLPGVARQGTAEQAFRHLLNRSGLITETSTETFQFVHRTFQDYLAAMEFAEERDFGLLAGHAGEEQWHDVIRMTVGHCGRHDRADLLDRLLAEAQRADGTDRFDILLTTVGCLPYAPELSRDAQERVLDALRPHLRAVAADRRRHVRMSGGGESVLPLLSELARRPDVPSDAIWNLAHAVGTIGGDRALDLLVELVPRADGDFAAALFYQWRHFDAREFADRVLAVADLALGSVPIHSAEHVAELLRLAVPVPMIDVNGFGCELDELAPLAEHIEAVTFNAVATVPDLAQLRSWSQLNNVRLFFCGAVDLAPLRGLPLRQLWVVDEEERDLDLFGGFPDLEVVGLGVRGLDRVPGPLPTVLRVHVYAVDTVELGRVRELFPTMVALFLDLADECTEIDLRPLADTPGLRIRIDPRDNDRPVRLLGAELFSDLEFA